MALNLAQRKDFARNYLTNGSIVAVPQQWVAAGSVYNGQTGYTPESRIVTSSGETLIVRLEPYIGTLGAGYVLIGIIVDTSVPSGRSFIQYHVGPETERNVYNGIWYEYPDTA